MLISFEGIDGCGKSTQIELLKNYLNGKDRTVHIFREPGGTELSEKIRSLLLHDSDEMDPVTEMLLFSAARSQLISEKVKPLLSKGEVVILDRFYDSTTAYQGYGRKSVPIETIHKLNRIASHNTAPDITFYLKISPDDAAKRTANQNKDRMEKAGKQFFDDVATGYDQLSQTENRFVTLDATQEADKIHSQIIQKIVSHL